MYKNNKIAAVVPAYNEGRQLARVVNTMPDFIDHIVVIDDKSKDNTADVARELQEENPRLTLIEHAVNQGVGGAIATGYKWVRDNGVDVAVVMAGDGQMDPKDLPAILDPVVEDEADYSKGNRLFSGVAYQKIPKIRYFGNSVLSLLTKIASGYWHIADSQSGYTAINRKALEAIDWDRMYKRYGQPNDLLVRLNVAEMRVRDVHIDPVYNVGEVSGIKINQVVFTISWLLIKLFFWRLKEKYIIRDFHPLVFFYLLGVGLLLISVPLFLRTFFLTIATGTIPELNTLTWMFAFGMGLQSTFFAMWFDMESNKHLK